MSYSRWLESKWYIFPCTDNTIVIWRAGEGDIRWKKNETYEEIMERVKSTIQKDAEYDDDIQELKEILEENREDIEKYIDKW